MLCVKRCGIFEICTKFKQNTYFLIKLCLRPPPSIIEFFCLLYINKKAQKHNNKIFKQTMGLIYYFQAKDIRHMNLPCFTLSKINPSKIGGLHYEIHLNPNMLIKWCAWNYCIEDGLINAIEGILKSKITFNIWSLGWLFEPKNSTTQEQINKILYEGYPTIQNNYGPIITKLW